MSSQFIQLNNDLMVSVSALSLVSCASVIFSFILFPGLKKKSYLVVILYIGISDFLAALATTMGIPQDGSSACWFEGVVSNIFTLSGCLWTLKTVIMIHSIIARGKMIEVTAVSHSICWGIPIIVTFLPLINMTYGSNGQTWCWLKETNRTPSWGMTFWSWFNFYGILLGSLFAMFAVFGFLLFEISTNVHNQSKSVVRKVFAKLQYYPFIILFCWGLTAVHDLSLASSESQPSNPRYDTVSNVLPCFHGLLTSAAFWFGNTEVRRCWYNYFLHGGASNKSSYLTSLHSKVRSQIQSQLSGLGLDGEPSAGRPGLSVKQLVMSGFSSFRRTGSSKVIPGNYARQRSYLDLEESTAGSCGGKFAEVSREDLESGVEQAPGSELNMFVPRKISNPFKTTLRADRLEFHNLRLDTTAQVHPGLTDGPRPQTQQPLKQQSSATEILAQPHTDSYGIVTSSKRRIVVESGDEKAEVMELGKAINAEALLCAAGREKSDPKTSHIPQAVVDAAAITVSYHPQASQANPEAKADGGDVNGGDVNMDEEENDEAHDMIGIDLSVAADDKISFGRLISGYAFYLEPH